MKEKIIEVINLKKQFGNNLILDDINFTINKGEAVSLIGPSGSGKSTILRCIADLETLTGGKILEKGTVEKIFENPETQRVKEFLNTIY